MESATAESYNVQTQYNTASKDTEPKYRPSNYNPEIKLVMLERIFGYSRQSFTKWEADENPNSPKIQSRIEKHPKYSRLNKRLYSIENVRYLWNYFREQKKLAPCPSMPLSIAVWNNKGGVGKSFITKELASMLSILMGFKVLVVDCDPQSDSTLLFNCDQKFNSLAQVDDRSMQPTIRDIIGWEDLEDNKYKADFDETVIHLSPTLSIIPSDEDLAYFDMELRHKTGITFNAEGKDTTALTNIERLLQDLYSRYDYDIVLFDCPPQISEFVHNVLWAVDRLIVPVEVEAKCLHSIFRVYNHLKLIAEYVENYRFEKILAVPNKFQVVQLLHQEAYQKLKELFSTTLLSQNVLPLAAAVGKSDEAKEPLFMGAFSGNKGKNTGMVRRFSNEMWKIAHEILEIKPHKDLFDDVSYEE
ncbi:MAG: ParA family protein [bacterium]